MFGKNNTNKNTNNDTNKNKIFDALSKSIKGYGANAIAITLTQPLEVLRIQSQICDKPLSVLSKNIYQTQHIKGFYRGLGASLVTQPVYWSIFFPLYHYLENNTSWNGFITSNVAGTIGVVATNPLWVLRTRLQAESIVADKEPIKYRNFFTRIIQKEGFLSLYKGTPITLVKNLQMGIQMPLYKLLKQDYEVNPLIAGALSKLVSSSIVYPMDTIRTNVRTHRGTITYYTVIKDIHKRRGGILNFYRGVGIYWITQVPIFAITMGVFEKLI